MECKKTELQRTSLGCWKDVNHTAISGGVRFVKPLPHLDIVDECQSYAADQGWPIFGVQKQYVPEYEEYCMSAVNAGDTYQRYGVSQGCQFGKGGVQAQTVYFISCPGAYRKQF